MYYIDDHNYNRNRKIRCGGCLFPFTSLITRLEVGVHKSYYPIPSVLLPIM